jgi:hypothetical protein
MIPRDFGLTIGHLGPVGHAFGHNRIRIAPAGAHADAPLGPAHGRRTARQPGTASFVGIERVSGSIAGRTGTFVLQGLVTLTRNRVTGRWSVVSGSGTGDLAGLRGDGGFTAELGQGADITLDHWFE